MFEIFGGGQIKRHVVGRKIYEATKFILSRIDEEFLENFGYATYRNMFSLIPNMPNIHKFTRIPRPTYNFLQLHSGASNFKVRAHSWFAIARPLMTQAPWPIGSHPCHRLSPIVTHCHHCPTRKLYVIIVHLRPSRKDTSIFTPTSVPNSLR